MSNGGISMLNPGLGINKITTPQQENMSIAGHKKGVSPALSVSGNEQGFEVYNEKNMDSIVDRYLCPRADDPDLMSPHVFQHTVQGALEKLGAMDSDNPVSALGSDIAQNNEIVRMFTSLVIPG
ncbi:hypothetical protein [Desulfospira joergensenii]|uniref:type III secretion apparatus assembly protein SctX n=1 Tax=Desulfospira joergensenii TaxID=53329 RepID=UPI0003B77AB7|nr:hypothetical protein [Desulfospira joergensenii]